MRARLRASGVGSQHRGPRGQALVEFALVAPIFFLVFFGLVDTARLVYTSSVVSQSAREGARLAAVEASWIGMTSADDSRCNTGSLGSHVCPTSAGFIADVKAASNRMVAGVGTITQVYVSCNTPPIPPAVTNPETSGPWTITNTCFTTTSPVVSSAAAKAGNLVSVRVVVRYTPIIPVIGQLIGPLDLAGSATMVIQ